MSNIDSPSSPQVDVVILSATWRELKYLLNTRINSQFEWKEGSKTENDEDFIYHLGKLPNTELILAAAHAKDMGLVEAAVVTTRAILAFKPKLIAMIGVCAGREAKGVNLGNLIVPGQAIHYRFGEVENGELNPQIKSVKADVTYHERINKFFTEDNGKFAKNVVYDEPEGKFNIFSKPDHVMGSSDYLVKDKDLFKQATERDRNLVAVEMESYAFLRTAELFKTPAIVLKSVMDYADQDKDDKCYEYSVGVSTEALTGFLTYAHEHIKKKEP